MFHKCASCLAIILLIWYGSVLIRNDPDKSWIHSAIGSKIQSKVVDAPWHWFEHVSAWCLACVVVCHQKLGNQRRNGALSARVGRMLQSWRSIGHPTFRDDEIMVSGAYCIYNEHLVYPAISHDGFSMVGSNQILKQVHPKVWS